ncbi:MAG: LuxR C-terminal-related transcriptional regulator [Coriobacteriales bacterium]|nr:LuxR C-terminal-related transcriptional regulator [Coriobacteriales bacterium]
MGNNGSNGTGNGHTTNGNGNGNAAGNGRSAYSSVRLFGLGFWQAWWMLCMCTPVVLPFNLMERFPFDPILMVLLLTALGYLGVVGLSRRLSPFVKRKTMFILTAACSLVGTLGMGILSHIEGIEPLVPLYVLATLVFSLGNALLLIMWGELWSTLATGRVGRYLYVSYAFAFVLFFALRELPAPLMVALVSLLPAVSTLVLHGALKEPMREPTAIGFDMEPIPRTKVFCTLILVSVVWGLSQPVLLALPAPDIVAQSFLLAGVSIAALALNLILTQPPLEAMALYRPILPTLTVGLLLMILLPPEFAFVGGGLSIFAIYSLDMLIMLVSTDIAFRARIPVALSFGLSIFAARMGTFAGAAGSRLLDAPLPLSAFSAEQVLIASAVVVILIGTLLFTKDDLQSFYRAREHEIANDASTHEKCENIGRICGLTTREMEVLHLLARGRSVPHICEELVIAQGTAKHHVSSIYRKIGIYDRQSLHDVIEQGSIGRGAF